MTIRCMTLKELGTVLDWAAAEGWNPGLDDAKPFHAADPGGFFLWEEGGVPVAAISVVNHDPSMAFLGLYICRPDYRSQGIGLKLWTEALRHAGDRTVGLDGVAAQQGNYARSGFKLAGATLRMEGRLTGAALPEARPEQTPQLLALDAAANGYARPAFLAEWLTPTATRRTVMLEDGTGFATARLCRRGCKIGPVVANDTTAALRLIRGAVAAVGAGEAIVDVPNANPALIGALQAEGFVETFRTARMYRGPAPQARPTLQATGTLELG
ncbi:GNAT family N-acetyltransferase [Cereibacter sphaeroides]|uniref:GNAT family N-acetyltransferase n=1 Tax=Cereibacter sphaeroides TaxID=1063 RepID=UPI001F1FE0F1|nr:GNAT family N-acetyltransferase [Cereibacter sphaeroides]MCE6960748.1 GNAT family N-acetyltransferase [Cereibacter sphaeroides]MCE6969986.1 GNAT family N-acetyltransferase [Cereibacter sphaeroides]MCE6974374.1 GNAT family N-acetyltransferase [Cereibacter sphaeroides]